VFHESAGGVQGSHGISSRARSASVGLATLQVMWVRLTGWLDRRKRDAVAYPITENRLLRRQLGDRLLRLTDDDRRRLAAEPIASAAP